jgi:hypothetical protein
MSKVLLWCALRTASFAAWLEARSRAVIIRHTGLADFIVDPAELYVPDWDAYMRAAPRPWVTIDMEG